MKISKYTIVVSLMLALFSTTVYTQTINYSLTRLGVIQFPVVSTPNDTVGGSDVWGWTGPDGTEYALMGVRDGIAVVNAMSLEVITTVPGPKFYDWYYHRDIKTYRHYAYAVAEMGGTNEGISVIDLQYLPDSVRFVGAFPVNNVGHVTSHNLSIDTLQGYAYLEGNSSQPVRILDLSDPEHPTYVNSFGSGFSVHDIYAYNDTVYVAEGYQPYFSIWDCTDKLNPVMIVRINVPTGGYLHNVWPTEDGRYILTTEETAYMTVKVWDVSDPGDVNIVGEWLGANRLAHNVQMLGNLAFISHYESGVSVVDIADPANPVEIANYDTYPPSDYPSFHGCWGVYQYTQNGFVYASDLEGRLTVLQFQSSSSGIQPEPLPPISPASITNYPNPFNAKTLIAFHLPKRSPIELAVIDINGHTVEIISRETLPAGYHEREWDGAMLPSGVYFYHLWTTFGARKGKMVLIK